MKTIADILHKRAEESPERRAYLFLDDRGAEAESVSRGQLLTEAMAVASSLESYPPGARILIALPTSARFCYVFFGCMLANKISVPVPIPTIHRLQAMVGVIRECEASCVLVLPMLREPLRTALVNAGLGSVDVLAYEDLHRAHVRTAERPSPDDIAVLQFTSGSTGSPKGVKISHGNIVANERMIFESFGHSDQTTVVGWAPLFHDQGLVGNLIQPLYAGADCVLMAPMTFLTKPHLWLAAISKYSAHTSGGPNFCYDLCTHRIADVDSAQLDLSTWKVAFNGAEPISPATLQRFSERFGPHGFSPQSFFLCYGMAEASLYVSGAHADASCLSPAKPVHSGLPHPDMSLVFRPTPESKGIAEGEEICISGTNVASGYWGDRAKDSYFEQDGKRYFRTGDVGFMRDGFLVITGRLKEMMIVRGKNIHPYDIERTIEQTHDAFLPSACAVVAIGQHERQDVIAVQEIDRTARHTLDFKVLGGLVRKSVVHQHDVLLKRVLFARPGFIPKTSSGKIRRAALAQRLEDGGDWRAKIIATA